MRIFKALILFTLTASAAQAYEREPTIQPISAAEAAAIVKAQEEARELAKDLREQELKNAEIRATATAAAGGRKVIFNRVEPVEPVEPKSRSSVEPVTNSLTDTEIKALLKGEPYLRSKESIHLTLSGTVWDKTVSELWWNCDGERYRVFVNANFLLLSGLGDFEDEQAHYTSLMMIAGQQSGRPKPTERGWQPTLADFSSEGLEYIVVDPKDDAEIDPAAFAGIEAMLRYYAANHEEMQIRYDNAQKIREAKAAYLEANPPKERDTIINFRPRKHTPGSHSTEN